MEKKRQITEMGNSKLRQNVKDLGSLTGWSQSGYSDNYHTVTLPILSSIFRFLEILKNIDIMIEELVTQWEIGLRNF